MYFEIAYDPTACGRCCISTALRWKRPSSTTGATTEKGLPSSRRLYDFDYVPCPMPDSASEPDRFARDLFRASSDEPKNTARWIVELPLAAVRKAFETHAGCGDGDQADRILAVETRFGADLTTGTRWPVESTPPNLSVTYAYFYGDPEDVPFGTSSLPGRPPAHAVRGL